MRNWTVKEAVETIRAGKDVDGIKEIAKYFPMFFRAVCMNDIDALTAGMGSDKFTVRRVEQGYAALVEDADAEDATEVPADVEDAGADEDLSSKSTKELMKLCDKRGIKVPHYGKNKQFYLDALQNAGGESDGEDAEDDAEEDTEADAYEGKTAMELYKLAKSRGLKVAPKKKASVYAEALRKADAEAEQAEDQADDDDWGDEDDAEEEAPKKATKAPAKKTPAKATKKAPAKKAEAEEEDGEDDWDI
jgi:hypothetical protein